MKTFDKSLYDRKIIMISDYVDPDTYSLADLELENDLLKKIEDEISFYGLDYKYCEFKSLEELQVFLKKEDRDNVIIFNWFEEVNGDEKEAHLVTDLLADMQFIFTGAETDCLKITGSKKKTKDILIEKDICTPRYFEVKKIHDVSKNTVELPIIVKLADMHCSAGLTNDNVVYEEEKLKVVARRMLDIHNSPLLFAEYINGEEYLIPVWGNDDKIEILPLCKIHFKDTDINEILTEASKIDEDSEEYKNTPYNLLQKEEVSELVDLISDDIINAYKVLGFKDYGRFEIRVRDNQSYIIDANPNPSLCYSGLFGSAGLMGYNYGETILKICEFALSRKQNGTNK